MSNLTLVAILLMIMAVAYQLGLTKSRAIEKGTVARMHSRPGYYGMLTALWCGVPAFLIFAIWSLIEPTVIRSLVIAEIVPHVGELSSQQIAVQMRRIENVASGFAATASVQDYEIIAAERLTRLQAIGSLAMIGAMAAVAMAALVLVRRRIHPNMRARNAVETFTLIVLMMCSAVAVMTTIGIVLSMLGESLRFFEVVSPIDFFFGTTWNPAFSTTSPDRLGDFGLLPLLWGTLMVTVIALLIAIPVGLMTAIYMAEYAPSWVRSSAKPVIEVLAGIPTIVYGVFALMIVGPFFADLGETFGITIRATSALTAGVVMGIMIIPFISSLADDVITQVPRAMRDGSLGLGATKSETIRKVVLPAALPGIVGAFLLATSRAVGETMIVLLAAGNSPSLHANPFEAVSTVTVSIVNQLTGDQDFASAQSLVAFALGLTLFVITLILNVIALIIVRKYREQYE
ncbi:MAG: phosphate ABC transporter permease subunit PstC [Marinobacter sp.]|nr:phosphate ABC transporter permease subunit PstC [Marinobacter sp.]